MPRTMSPPCQKCWRNIVCQRCSIRVGSSPTTRSARSSIAPTTARVCHSSVASPQPCRPGSSVRTRTKIQFRMRALQTCASTAVIFTPASEERHALVHEPGDLAAVDVRVRDPVRPAVAVLVEHVVEADAVEQVEILVAGQVARVVVRVAEREGGLERAARADTPPLLVEELERVRDDRGPADPQRLQLGADRRVGALDHVGVHRERAELVAEREVLRGGGGVHVLGPGLGELGHRLRCELRPAGLQLVEAPGNPAAAELDGGGGCAERDAARSSRSRAASRALRWRPPGRTRRAARSCGGSRRGFRTSSPTRRCRRRCRRGTGTRRPGPRPRPRRAAARGSRRSRASSRRRSASRGTRCSPRSQGARRPAPSTRSTGTESSTGRSWRTRLTVIPGARPVRPAGSGRPPVPPGRVDGTRQLLLHELDVALERGGICEAGHRRAARDARRAVVVRRVHEHGLGRDPGQLLHAPTHALRQVGAGEDEVDGDERERRVAVVEDERLAEHRLVDPRGEGAARRPAARGQPAGRGDVHPRDPGGETAHRRATNSS